MALAVATGFAWIAVPAALVLVALAGGALVLELRARRDADVMLHAAPFTAPVDDSDTSALLARRAAALTAPKHLRALAAAVRGYAHGRPHLLVPRPPAALLLSRHTDAADRIATRPSTPRMRRRTEPLSSWSGCSSDPRPSEDRLRRVERLLAA